MRTLHRAALLVADPAEDAPPLTDGAVLVDGAVIAAVGRYAELAGTARVREWPGLLRPGLVEPEAGRLLDRAYHPDPREERGELPLEPPPGLTDEQWGGSARRGLQRMLARGATAVVGPFTRPAVRTAVARTGLRVVPAPAAGEARRALTVGGPADFAVFADGACLVTVLDGRIVFRRRTGS
ncbi:hypothetical protein ACIQBJ_25580 [Kitasatospora sp. NPDC088391]|uniref:hypothetical protein n=1 Tax=Kitasatospora sp. NPDC088391 TaxID=3364074 RepID=UPI0038140424